MGEKGVHFKQIKEKVQGGPQYFKEEPGNSLHQTDLLSARNSSFLVQVSNGLDKSHCKAISMDLSYETQGYQNKKLPKKRVHHPKK